MAESLLRPDRELTIRRAARMSTVRAPQQSPAAGGGPGAAIARHRVVGDLRTVALVSDEGVVD
jgi:hypothetical protein